MDCNRLENVSGLIIKAKSFQGISEPSNSRGSGTIPSCDSTTLALATQPWLRQHYSNNDGMAIAATHDIPTPTFEEQTLNFLLCP
jgi:hypothetical protein